MSLIGSIRAIAAALNDVGTGCTFKDCNIDRLAG
jgi:hypothetical protein